jgi:DNA-binding transcriptional ArsR family regulator
LDSRPEFYELETVEQLRALADPLRLRMIDEVTRKAMTVTQVGEAVGVPANKAHYHMRELERVGLVRIVETREKSGILEKYYMTVARDLNVPKSLLQQASPDESIAAASELVQSVMRNFMESFAHAVRTQNWDSTIHLDYNDLWMSVDEWRDASRQIKEILKPYQGGEESPERRQLSVLLLMHPTPGSAQSGGTQERPADTVAAQAAGGPAADDRPISSPTKGLIIEAGDGRGAGKRRRVIAAGTVGYSRSDLERLAEAGETLDLNILGTLSFSANVPPELVDRTIARVRHRGLINASRAVKAVLKLKGAKLQE